MKPEDRDAVLASMTAEERAEVETNLQVRDMFRGVAKELPWRERIVAYIIGWVAGQIADKAVEEAASRKLWGDAFWRYFSRESAPRPECGRSDR